jgi:hypothetical protein
LSGKIQPSLRVVVRAAEERVAHDGTGRGRRAVRAEGGLMTSGMWQSTQVTLAARAAALN